MDYFYFLQVYEDINTGQPKRGGGYIPQESYENTDQLRHGQSHGQLIYPPMSEPGNVTTDFKKTSADNPFRCKSSLGYVRDETEPFNNNKNPAAESFRSLLLGPGQGPSGDLLKKLEDAISRGDHK